MLKGLRNNKAQAMMLEYSLIFFLVVGMITAMSLYFKRSMQARIRDARVYMFKTVQNRTAGYYDGNLYVEYEPYYTNTVAMVARSELGNSTLLPSPGKSSGIFRKLFTEETDVTTISITAPPRNAM